MRSVSRRTEKELRLRANEKTLPDAHGNVDEIIAQQRLDRDGEGIGMENTWSNAQAMQVFIFLPTNYLKFLTIQICQLHDPLREKSNRYRRINYSVLHATPNTALSFRA